MSSATATESLGAGLIATTYLYGSAIIGLALLATIDLFRHHPNPQGDLP